MSTAPSVHAAEPARARSMEKYALYTKWSVTLAAPLMWLIFTIPSMTATTSTHAGIAPLLWAVASAALTLFVSIILFREPALELFPERRGRARGAKVSFMLVLVGWIVCILMAVLAPVSIGAWAHLYAIMCTALFALAHAPWMRHKWIAVTVAALLTSATQLTVDASTAFTSLCIPFIFLTATLSGFWGLNVLRDADRARQLDAELRVSAERLRFTQELHDTMGQRLAAISLKTQVAIALVERGDRNAMKELRELQELVKASTADMRAVAHGYRRINLATEIAEARALLGASHINVRVDGDSLDVPDNRREDAAWFVREATTNILRHSHATSARLTLAEDSVATTNDGALESPGPLSGLESLRRRVAAASGSITVEHDAPHFTVRLSFDEGPASVGPAPTHAPEESA
ncbi:histidine kinase [Dermabacter sp. Marseille-Q3180]|uniref:sensor histidine kinase n=1 Tax=Dermabacter sp. Marseille-Q3180 TaxID=2758090 RepID=UPI0020251F30|nr:histidine kinase [Dermabacter sp. Marseille-Q3180]